jgi:hypothetical protein
MNKQQRRDPEEVRRYIKSIKRHAKKPEFAFDMYLKNTNINFDFMNDMSIDRGAKREYREHVNRLFIIYECCGLEVFLKHIIIQYAGYWKESGINSLLTEQISLADAYKTFSHGDISREHVIAHTNTFQSYFSVNKVFTSLYGGNFFNDVYKSYIKYHTAEEFEDFDFRNPDSLETYLKELFELRNRLVHECSKEKFDASGWGLVSVSFVVSVKNLLKDKFKGDDKTSLTNYTS